MRCRPSDRKGRLGFTLIELLVVISIIALLAGLSMTAIRKVREKAQIAACAKNLGNLYLAAEMYLQENRSYPYPAPRAKGEKASAFSEEDAGAQAGFAAIQLLFDEQLIEDPDVVICPGSMDTKAEIDEEGHVHLDGSSCSYAWAREKMNDGASGLAPLAADGAQRKPRYGDDNHRRGRNVLEVQGKVTFKTERELLKERILERLTAE